MGDFNSKVEKDKREEKGVLGRYCFGKRNERVERLVELCTENSLEILNSVYKKREERRWVWISQNQSIEHK